MTTPLREQTANAADSLLDGAINNSVTSLDVDDASAFPAAGNFRILIDSEIILVTAVSSNTFTLVRGQEGTAGASHLDNAPVTHILTAGSLNQLGADNVPFWGGSFPPLNRLAKNNGDLLVASDFTWVNQGTATVTDQAGTIIMRAPATSGGDQLRIQAIATPSAPYTYTAAVQTVSFRSGAGGSTPIFGMGLRDSSNGKMVVFMILNDTDTGWRLQITYLDNETTFSSSPVSRDNYTVIGHALWLRVTNDNTNLLFSISCDGLEWIQVASVGKTAHTAALNQAIWFCDSLGTTSSGPDMLLRLLHWSQS